MSRREREQERERERVTEKYQDRKYIERERKEEGGNRVRKDHVLLKYV
jgi:hypothetical protein